MSWEKFEKAVHGHTRVGTITIRKSGLLAIAYDVVEHLGSPRYIVFMFNESELKIGIKPSNDQNSSYPLRKVNRSLMRIVSAKLFLDHYKLQNVDRRAYPVEYEDGMATFRLTSRLSGR